MLNEIYKPIKGYEDYIYNEYKLKKVDIKVNCSKGTYIRALARDIGTALGSGAYLTALRRTRVGDVRVEDCLTLDEFPQWLEQQEIVPYQQTEEK